MVATTAMVLGINALDVKSAEEIKMGLQGAQVIPASASAYAAASASVSDVYKAAVESVLVQAAIVKAENSKYYYMLGLMWLKWLTLHSDRQQWRPSDGCWQHL